MEELKETLEETGMDVGREPTIRGFRGFAQGGPNKTVICSSGDQFTLVICCIEGMKNYPVIWGL